MSLTDATSPEPCCAVPCTDAAATATARRGRLDTTLVLRHAGPRTLQVAFECVGPAGAPVVIVAGGISADRHVAANAADDGAGWWDAQVGPGRALDTGRVRVLAIDWVGADGTLDAPLDTADQADAIAAVLDHLGIARAAAFVGASYGAMVGLQFAARHPSRVRALVAISGAHRAHPYSSAWRALQRQVVRAGGGSTAALGLARQWAMLSYRTPEEFAERFAAPATLVDGQARVAAEDYLDACAERFVARFSATAFLRLSESIDLHAVDPAQVRTPATLVAVSEDRLVPSSDLHALAAHLGGTTRLHHLRSRYGHDAFLTEHAAIAAVLREAVAGVSP
jgi:homoserine O-acetyltransferase